MSNPLFVLDQLPVFSQIKPEHIVPAVESQLNENRNQLATLLEQDHFTWENLVEPLALQEDKLSKLFSPISHMNAVVSSPKLREAHDSCLPLLTEYATELGQNKPLYDAYCQILEQPGLSDTQKKILLDAKLSFELTGVGLADEPKARYKAISNELSQLQSSFSNNLLDATMAWTKLIDNAQQLDGLPESALAAAEQAANNKQQVGYLLTLEFPSYYAVVTYAKDRALREEVYRAYTTRAATGEFDNSPLMQKILALRDEQAKLLGFSNYAELSIAQKMAESPTEVINFLENLANKSLPQAHAEFDELQAFAKQLDGVEQLQAWDVSYYSEKLREQKFQLSQEALRPWFPKDRVLQGLFSIVERIYGINIKKRQDVEVWHPDVEFFDIYQGKQFIGSFYLDLYARENKRGGAWMNDCRDRFKLGQQEQLPVAYLTCNFNGPIADKPALFTHDEVVTLFHEFGHGLHHLLTEIDEVQVSGINGVEWDAVELPSQFMENYCYEKQSLALIAGHYKTGEPLSEQQLDTLYQARNFQCALQMVRQLEFALFDMKLHTFYQQNIDVTAVLDEVREQVAVIKPPKWNRFENSFSHIFAGGYAAGYYSYKWAEVLSADVWQYFLEHGILEPSTGKHFLKSILSKGGSKPAMQLFEQFRGRKPSVEPLLSQLGIN